MGIKNLGGAPLGNHNRANGLEWKLAIKRALARKGNGDSDKVLLEIATLLVECALDRTDPHFMFAIREIGNRLDGKPRVSVDVATDYSRPDSYLGISGAFMALQDANAKQEALTVIDDEQTKQHKLTGPIAIYTAGLS